jgi:hypothetical protein
MPTERADLEEAGRMRAEAAQGEWDVDAYRMSSIIVQVGSYGDWDCVLDTGSGPKCREDALFCRYAAIRSQPAASEQEK